MICKLIYLSVYFTISLVHSKQITNMNKADLISKFNEKYDLKDTKDTLDVVETEKGISFSYTCNHCKTNHKRLCNTLLRNNNTSSSRSLCTNSYFNDKKSAKTNIATKNRDRSTRKMRKVSDPIYLTELNERFNTSLIQNIEVLSDIQNVIYYRYECLRCNETHVRRYIPLVKSKRHSPHHRSLCTKSYHYDLKNRIISNSMATYNNLIARKLVLQLTFSDSDTEESP